MLTDEQIVKFQTIWKQRFDEEITREQALEYGIKLIRLIQVVCRKAPSSDIPVGSLDLSENILK